MTGRIDGRNRRQTRTTTLADWKKTHKGLEVGQTLSQPTGDPKLRNKTTAPISFTQPQTQQVTALTVVPK